MTAVVALIAAALALMAAGSRIPRSSASPVAGVALAGTSLMLRAALSLAAIAALIVIVPRTTVFADVTDWCLDQVFPLIGDQLDLSGHSLGDLALALPALGLAALVASALVGVRRAARGVHRWLRGNTIGRGPSGSFLVRAEGFVLAAAGFLRPRVVVSPGALLLLDDQELAAALRHERAHIRRGHRFAVLLGALAAACSRFLPGTRRAFADLNFQLERDADRVAVRGFGDSVILASAICKAALGSEDVPGSVAVSSISGADVPARVRELLADSVEPGTSATRASAGLAALSAAVSLLLFAALVSLVWMGIAGAPAPVAFG